jgi:hypothetical protein
MTREEVLDQVRSAFAGVPAPADPAEADDEALEDAGIHLLGPEAVRYHVPRIVARALAAEEALGEAAESLQSLVFLLRHIKEPHARRQVCLFDRPQRAAVLDVLRFLKGKTQYVDGESLKLVERAVPLWERME